MNWISNVVRPRIRSFLSTKREVPDNLWVQCPESGQMVFHKDLEANAFVVPGSDHHMRMSAQDRLAYTFDDGAYEAVPVPAVPVDPLKFRDGRRYVDRLRDAKSKVELEDAVLIGEGTIQGSAAVVAVQDFRFMGGSLGMAAGEAVIAAIERALSSTVPFILFAASGGARMQEGILSLMQMPRTTIAVQRLREAGLPYIVVLTDPTTGGVTASYAMLGDVQIAEPGALICFAGPRVIEQTIREQLPEGFQRAEYLLEHGMIDMVVHRHKMRQTLGRLCRVLAPARESDATVAEVGEDALSPALNGLANDVLVAPETIADAEPVAGGTAEGQDMAVSGEARLDAPTDPAVKSAITDAPADPDQPELPLAPGDAAAELEKPAPAPAESGLLSSLGFATSIIGSQAKPEPKEPKDEAEPAAEARAPKTKASKSKSAKRRAGGDQSE